MHEGLPDKACWRREDAEDILRIEALAGDDTLFLATHTPIQGFGVAGAKRQDLAEPTEEALLDALSRPERRHAFCVVQGDPGSGKSHLIRWLEVKWPGESDLVLLLQRADGSLQGALSQLQDRVTRDWPQFAKIFERLDRRQKAAVAGRAEVFHSTLAAMMRSTYSDEKKPDAAFCDQHDLNKLLLSLPVRESWTSPRRILELMDGKADARNSESARFNLEDMLELARVCGAVSDSVQSEKYARRIRSEADKIRDWIGAGETLEQIRVEHADELPASLSLVAALNARLNDAVQFVIGVTSADLQQMFLALRRALKGQARLVMLLEDITAWQGLDNGLIDALVVDADTRDDICPMISVVGVTPEYHDDLRKNYADRITHEVQLAETTTGSAEAVTLRADADRHAFTARYLNATRAGVRELADWRTKLDGDPQQLPPNPCIECGHRAPCHAAFGEVQQIGLYPFSRRSIDTLFFALKADDKGQTHRTPRGLLQSVLGPTLRNPGVLDRHEYPGADIETEKLDERVRFLPGALNAVVEARNLAPAVKERLRRTLVYWGNPQRPLTTTDKSGALQFAEIPKPIFEAFDLPWIGQQTGARAAEPPAAAAPPPTSFAAPEPASSTPPGVLAEPAPPGDATTASPVAAPPLPTTTPPPPRPTPPTRGTSKAKLQRLRDYVTTASAGGSLGEPALWNEVLFEILQRIDPRSIGVDLWTWDELFTANLVQLERTVQARSASFSIPRQTWVFDGVEAYCALAVGGEPPELTEYRRRRLAFMLRRLGRMAVAHASKRRPPLPDGEPWDMAATAAQTLLARAWLKGAVSPLAPTAEQWLVILSDETEADTDPQSRTDAWRDALRNSNQQHKNLRTLLREMTSLPQGTSSDYGVADTGSVAMAIIRLQRRMSFLPISETPIGAAWLDDKGLRATAVKMRDYLGRVATYELKRLEERAGSLGDLLRGEAVSARAQRLNKAITEVLPQIRELPADHESRWRGDWERARPVLEAPALVAKVQSLVSTFRNPETLPTGPPERLAWLIEQPAGELRQLLDLLKAGDDLARLLADRAEGYAKAAAAGGDLTALHIAGQALQAAATAAKAAWSAQP